MEKIIDVGKYIEKGIDSLERNFSFLWTAIDTGISWLVERMNDLFMAFPFWLIIIFVAVLAYTLKAGKNSFTKQGFKKGIGIFLFIIFGFTLIVLMGYWKDAIQTTTLVLVSTFIALLLGIPLGILTSRSKIADSICLLYTSDAADEEDSVDLGGRRIIK